MLTPIPLAVRGWMMVGDPYGTLDGTFARRGQVAHIRLGSSWGVTFGMLGLIFALLYWLLIW